jgi:acyl carrier protein
MKPHQDAAQILREALVKVYPLASETLGSQHSLLDLGIDSLTLTTLAAELEATCRGELSEEELQRLMESRTLGELTCLTEDFLSRVRGRSQERQSA